MASGDTTTTTITGSINTSLISRVMGAYALDANVALQHMRIEPVQGLGTKTLAFQKPTKSTGVAAITEGTAMSNSTLTTSNTTVAVSEVGILRRVTKLASRTSVFGEAGLYSFVIEDGARLVMEKFEVDAWSQWTNASTSVGTSGADFTLANYAGGLSQLFINKARGPFVCLLSGTQIKNLRAALVSSAAAHLSNGQADQVLTQTGDDGYCNSYLGCNIWASNNAQASGGDTLGVFMVDGAANPAYAATGVALGWMPEPEVLGVPSIPGRDLAVTAAYGLGEINDFCYVKITTVT